MKKAHVGGVASRRNTFSAVIAAALVFVVLALNIAAYAFTIEENTKYIDWFCGHWHIDKNIDRMHFLFNSFMKIK